MGFYVKDSLEERGKTSWRLTYHYVGNDGESGGRLRKTLTGCRGKRDASAMANRYLASLGTPSNHATGCEQTLLEYHLRMIDDLLAMGSIEPCTHRGYVNSSALLGDLGAMRMDEISKEDVVDMVNGLVSRGYSAATVSGALKIVKRCLSDAADEGLIACNVAAKVPGPKRLPKKPRSLSPAERDRLLEIAASLSNPLSLAILLALSTGMRRGEVCALRWNDVDLPSRKLTVRHAISKGREEYMKAPKSGLSRTLPIGSALREGLADRLKWARRRCEAAEVPFSGDLFVLGDVDGAWLSPVKLERSFTQVSKAFKVAGGECRFHWLRHTFATSMISGGVDVKTLSAWLGHADPGFTLRVYVDLDDEAMAGSLSVVDTMVAPPRAPEAPAAPTAPCGAGRDVLELINEKVSDMTEGGGAPGVRELLEWARALSSNTETRASE